MEGDLRSLRSVSYTESCCCSVRRKNSCRIDYYYVAPSRSRSNLGVLVAQKCSQTKQAEPTDRQTDIGRPFLDLPRMPSGYPGRGADKALLMASLGCLGSSCSSRLSITCLPHAESEMRSQVALPLKWCAAAVALALIDNSR